MPDTLRTFIGCRLPLVPVLRTLLRKLGLMGRAVRPEHPDNLHVTLKFLGETDVDQIPEITARLASIARKQPGFECRIAGVGVFPDEKRPAVFWAGFADDAPLRELAGQLSQDLEPLGFAPERRPYHPHLTLARITARPPEAFFEALQSHATSEFATITVASIELFQTEILPQGRRYLPLASYSLSGGQSGPG